MLESISSIYSLTAAYYSIDYVEHSGLLHSPNLATNWACQNMYNDYVGFHKLIVPNHLDYVSREHVHTRVSIMVCSIIGTLCHMGMKALLISLFWKNNLISMFDSLKQKIHRCRNLHNYSNSKLHQVQSSSMYHYLTAMCTLPQLKGVELINSSIIHLFTNKE